MTESGDWIKRTFSKDAAAGWTAVFTAVLMVFTGLLYMVSDRATDVNIATQRATANLSGPVWAKIPSPDGKSIIGWRFMVAWQNSGRTPLAMRSSKQMYISVTPIRKGASISALLPKVLHIRLFSVRALISVLRKQTFRSPNSRMLLMVSSTCSFGDGSPTMTAFRTLPDV